MEPVPIATAIIIYLAKQAGKLIEGRAGSKINTYIDRILNKPTIDKAFDQAFTEIAPENKTIKKNFLNKLLTAPEVVTVLENTQSGALPQKQLYIDIFTEILPAGDPEDTADKFILALYKGLSKDQEFVNLVGLHSANKLADIDTTTKDTNKKLDKLIHQQPPHKTAWNIPKRNEFFTGRQEILNLLQSTLQSKHNVAINQTIHGLGGVGKSQIAIEYAHINQKDYDIAWWINAETKVTVEAALAKLIDSLNLPEKQATDQNIKVRAALDHLNKTPDWLIIFDNVESSDDIWPYIPKAGHSIITTRNQNLPGFKQSISIDMWTDEEAQRFVKTRIDNASENDINALCEVLGNLPLAMEQAVAYIAASELSIPDYIDLFNNNQQKYLGKSSIPKEEYNETVATTWTLAIQKIQESMPGAAALLNMCAFMAPDNIPLDLIATQADALPESMQELLGNKGVMAEMRILFKRYSIATIENNTLSMHRLVQAVIRYRLEETQEKQSIGFVVDVIDKSLYGLSAQRDVNTWPTYKALHPHILACGKYAQEHNVNLERVGYLYNNLALYLNTIGLYEQVESLYIEARDIAGKVLGKEHPDYAASLNNLAELYRVQGRYDKAEPLYIESRDIIAKVLGKETPEYATNLNNLALLYHAQGQYDKAEPLYIESADIRAKVLGKEHPDYASNLNNLAGLYYNQGQYDKAEPLYLEAIRILENIFDSEHPDAISVRNNYQLMLDEKAQKK